MLWVVTFSVFLPSLSSSFDVWGIASEEHNSRMIPSRWMCFIGSFRGLAWEHREKSRQRQCETLRERSLFRPSSSAQSEPLPANSGGLLQFIACNAVIRSSPPTADNSKTHGPFGAAASQRPLNDAVGLV